MREVTSIIATAHDLKTPLNLLRQLALSLDLAPDLATQHRIQAQMVLVSERALRQVNDLSKVARLEDGLFAIEPISVRGLCDEVYRELADSFRLERRQLKISYGNRSRLALANRELLRSVIYNFCTNAMRYSDVETSSKLSVLDNHGSIRISVRDYGPALPSHIARSLRHGGLDHPTDIAMRPDSTGLGLYIVSQFVQYMRARLGIVQHHDGTSFFVDLPISQQATLF